MKICCKNPNFYKRWSKWYEIAWKYSAWSVGFVNTLFLWWFDMISSQRVLILSMLCACKTCECQSLFLYLVLGGLACPCFISHVTSVVWGAVHIIHICKLQNIFISINIYQKYIYWFCVFVYCFSPYYIKPQPHNSESATLRNQWKK